MISRKSKLLKSMALFIAFLLVLSTGQAVGQNHADEYAFTEATELTLTGKVFQDTPMPYQRMDFDRFGGWTAKDRHLLEMSAGVMVSFRTDSPVIAVKADFSSGFNTPYSHFADHGFDLYIKSGGRWQWAGNCCYERSDENGKVKKLVEQMEDSVKECLIYFPLFAKPTSVQVGVISGSVLEPGPEPFSHRICLHGSSFMHGVGTTRSGITVPAILSRQTGLLFCNLGVSGDCRMEPQFAAALMEADVEAFVFDAFSNGNAESVNHNLFPFIETLQSAKPGVPLIFMGTIYRHRRSFNQGHNWGESKKIAMADSLMKIAVKKYKDVYYIPSNAEDDWGDTTLDGVHPGDYGYQLWASSVRKKILRILRRYGIRP